MRIVVLFLLFLSSISLHAQNDFIIDRGETDLWQDFTYDMGNVFQGVGFAYSRPLYWDKNDLLVAGGVTAATLGFYAVDDNITRELTGQRDDIPEILLDYGYYAGAPQNNYGLSGAIYLTGLFTKNEKLRRTGVLLISSATATGFFQQLTKSATGRARPSAGLGKNHFRPFGGSSEFRSFPSGHAVLTFTNAHVIAKQFENPWVKAGIYTLGVVPGLSRIYEGKHFASDVFLSWALSYFMVEAIDLYLDRKYEQKYNDNRTKTTSLDLNFTLNSVGVSYTF
ncbi:phosphatase PAP2 family protein [Nonlabens antarcticus]|uniref:phosphatase PAP2 family protein n=1 Tax=Nonlabens antarcticus TaxID=392714 RepID=UPI001E52D4BA|nr:phosphatase PAP2 family protein [Nonlabens antarcticus]